MAIEPVEQKGSSIFSWATKKGKQFIHFKYLLILIHTFI